MSLKHRCNTSGVSLILAGTLLLTTTTVHASIGTDTLFSDNFNRANGAVGANYSVSGTANVSGNIAVGSGTATLASTANFANANYSVEIDTYSYNYYDAYTAGGNGISVLARKSGTTYYVAYTYTNAGDGALFVYLYKYVSGTPTSLGSYMLTGGCGYAAEIYKLGLFVDGSTISVKISGAVDDGGCYDNVNTPFAYQTVISVTDATISAIGAPAYSAGYDSWADNLLVKGTSTAATTIGDGASPSNKNVLRSSTNNAVDAFTLSTSTGTDTLTALTITFSGTTSADVAASGVKLWRDNGATPNEWDASDTQIGSGVTFSGSTASFSGLSEGITTSSVQYLVTYDIHASATYTDTLLAYVSAATVTNALSNNDNTDATLTVISPYTTTIGDGTAPADKTVMRNSTNRAVDAFTLSTDSSTDTLTALTVTFSGTTAANVAASGVKLWIDDGTIANEWDPSDTQVGSGVSFSGTTATFSGLSESITTTSVQYLVTYNITAAATYGNTLLGRVSSISSSNTVVNNDTTDATLTVATFMSTNLGTDILFSDDFNRANGGVGASYSVSGTANVSSNKAIGSGTANLASSANFANANYSVELDTLVSSSYTGSYPNIGSGIAVYARKSGNTYYEASLSSNTYNGYIQIYLTKYVSGSPTVLSSTSLDAGCYNVEIDKLGLFVDGTTINVKVAGWTDDGNCYDDLEVPFSYQTVLSVTDFDITGIGAPAYSAGDSWADNFTVTGTALPPSPIITVTKVSSILSDPVNGATNPKRIPGAVIEITVSPTNSGTASPDADSTYVTDVIDATAVSFYVTDGVTFTDGTTSSALSLDTVSYSSTAAPGPYVYTYTPVPDGSGYDGNITAVKITTTGTFAHGGSPDPGFSVKYKLKMK